MSQPFNPNEKVDGFTFTLGELTHGGDCWSRMPAVYVSFDEEIPEGQDRYPKTEEQYERYGVSLPVVIEVHRDIEIGCENYQRIFDLGIAVQPCVSCPHIQGNS